MKKESSFSLFVTFALKIKSGIMEIINLLEPDEARNGLLMDALKNRKSTKEGYGEEISLRDLSDLLWAANGINRPETKDHTAPSAMHACDVDVYVCKSEGNYLYDAIKHQLKLVSKANLLPSLAMTQEYVASAKQIVVLVSDNRRIQQINDPNRLVILGGIDAGIVAQNINLFCAANGLIVVTRGYMDSDAVAKGLNLEKGMHPMLNIPLGYR